jgi:hypothetical protein
VLHPHDLPTLPLNSPTTLESVRQTTNLECISRLIGCEIKVLRKKLHDRLVVRKKYRVISQNISECLRPPPQPRLGPTASTVARAPNHPTIVPTTWPTRLPRPAILSPPELRKKAMVRTLAVALELGKIGWGIEKKTP